MDSSKIRVKRPKTERQYLIGCFQKGSTPHGVFLCCLSIFGQKFYLKLADLLDSKNLSGCCH